MKSVTAFVPAHDCVIETSLSVDECRDALGALTDTSAALWPRRDQGFAFRGEVGTRHFGLMRILNYRNSFQPVITGDIREMVGGSTVRVFMRLHHLVVGFMGVWGLGVIGGVGAVIAGLMSGQTAPHPMMLIPVAMLFLGAFLFHVPFRMEVGRTQTLLADILEGEIVYSGEPRKDNNHE